MHAIVHYKFACNNCQAELRVVPGDIRGFVQPIDTATGKPGKRRIGRLGYPTNKEELPAEWYNSGPQPVPVVPCKHCGQGAVGGARFIGVYAPKEDHAEPTIPG